LYVETPFRFDGLLELAHRWEIPGTLRAVGAGQRDDSSRSTRAAVEVGAAAPTSGNG
jgi:hypothetical protein